MDASHDFPRDPSGESSTDHQGYDDSEHCGQRSLYPELAASVARIQHSGFVPHATDGSRFSDHRRNHSVAYGTTRRDPVSYSLTPSHHGVTLVQQQSYEWDLVVENLNTQRSIQRDFYSHNSAASTSPWDNGSYHLPRADSSLPVFSPITDAQASWSRTDNDVFVFHPPPVGGERSFPRDDGHLIQPYSLPDDVVRVVPTIEQTQSDQLLDESRGLPLITNGRHDSMTQHPTFTNVQRNSGFSYPQRSWMTVIPQRLYAKKGNYNIQEPIMFKMGGRSGILARDAIDKHYAGLERRDELVFVDKSSVLTLRLEWPEYPSWGRKIRLDNWQRPPQRIKLEKLATEVTKCIVRFITDMMIRGKDTQVNDQESSYWRVGPNSIGIDSLVLVGLENVSKGSWQPRIGFLSHREINSSSTPFVI